VGAPIGEPDPLEELVDALAHVPWLRAVEPER